MSISEAVFLGVVQGIFMFFPVSSTSHLVLSQHFLINRGSALPNPESPEMLLFDLVVHLGTLVSIAVVFRRQLLGFLRSIARELGGAGTEGGTSPGDRGRPPGGDLRTGSRRPPYLFTRLFLLGLFSTAVSGALGLPLLRVAEQVFARPIAISATLAVTGVLLYWTDVVPARRRGLRDVTLTVALAIGIGQALSLLPGLSRSGLTIVAALAVGLKRPWAAQYSFFIAFPTIIAATGLQSILALRQAGAVEISFAAQLTGFAVAAVVGIFALKLVVTLLYRAKFRYFAWYVWTVAAAVVVTAGLGWL